MTSCPSDYTLPLGHRTVSVGGVAFKIAAFQVGEALNQGKPAAAVEAGMHFLERLRDDAGRRVFRSGDYSRGLALMADYFARNSEVVDEAAIQAFMTGQARQHLAAYYPGAQITSTLIESAVEALREGNLTPRP